MRFHCHFSTILMVNLAHFLQKFSDKFRKMSLLRFHFTLKFVLHLLKAIKFDDEKCSLQVLNAVLNIKAMNKSFCVHNFFNEVELNKIVTERKT